MKPNTPPLPCNPEPQEDLTPIAQRLVNLDNNLDNLAGKISQLQSKISSILQEQPAGISEKSEDTCTCPLDNKLTNQNEILASEIDRLEHVLNCIKL